MISMMDVSLHSPIILTDDTDLVDCGNTNERGSGNNNGSGPDAFFGNL